ncbi:MAG: sigma-70 family RNA polymerase sigma factor [Oscillospiraceae bacterium]|nr:sigma-70 family RNA polymerase sigma factor [Oscillospiraceae bacterium]MCL2277973.1 sigma-70 family RNA polymerase sigma factor [Oscillospiraceae bacterium]
MEDHEILDLFFKRSEYAIDETKLKYGKRLQKTAMNILHNAEDAEECVSDTLFQAWEAIPPATPASLGAYLAKITRNLSLNRWESSMAKKRGGGEVPLLLSELEDCIPGTAGPEEDFEATLVTEAINKYLETLEKATRKLFVLRYFHGESIRELSERFRISESRTKSILFRTRKKLGTYLEKEGVHL